MTYRQVFGAESAANDDLLEDCYVSPPGVVHGRPILIGKWGTGKTGLLLHRNAPLSRALREIDPDHDRIWYLDETGIQLQTLKSIEQICSNDTHLTKRLLEDLWRSEIIRAASRVLVTLRAFYGNPSGKHWDTLEKLTMRTPRRSIWDIFPSALGIVLSGEKVASATDFLAQIKNMHDEPTILAVQKCLADIQANPVQPVVAIEPIETPSSPIEEETDLAQILITCLLNVFHRDFMPSSRQLLKVEISIPWHRYLRDGVGEPQKLYPFIGRFRWTKSTLRSFINKRIEWEFRRLRRSFTPRGSVDAWNTLFPDHVKNSNTGDVESSFDYIVRHTQYRVRDLLRITRECVEHEAVFRDETNDEVLIGRGGLKITEKNIRAAVVRACKQTAGERVFEAERKFFGFQKEVEILRGIAIPFTVNDIKRRRPQDLPTEDTLNNMLNRLWNAGVIGVQLLANSRKAISQLKASFESGSLAREASDGNSAVFYVFEHATDRNVVDIITTFDGVEGRVAQLDISLKLVLHPMMFEFLDVRVNEAHPVGI